MYWLLIAASWNRGELLDVNPDGGLVKQEIYDYVTARPRLNMTDDGNVTVIGGVRRLDPGELPMVKSPNELPAPAKP